jgi:hypothetical protein
LTLLIGSARQTEPHHEPTHASPIALHVELHAYGDDLEPAAVSVEESVTRLATNSSRAGVDPADGIATLVTTA